MKIFEDNRVCEYCGKDLGQSKRGKKRRKDAKFCSQQCHDKDKYERASSSVRDFKEEFGLNKYAFKGLSKKLKLIELFGGKCEKCGYSKNIAAFDFHHIDPDSKNFEIKVQYLNWKPDDEILEEALKCMLLCANCHRELHNPQLDVEHVKKVITITESKL